jgi:hypothetical protein
MKKLKYYLVLEIPSSGKDFDDGKCYDYPKELPLPRIGEKLIFSHNKKCYYLKINDIKHTVDIDGIEVRIISEYYYP